MPRPAPARRDAYTAFAALPTRWIDNDAYGHLNNIVHYALIDTAVTNWQIASGAFDLSGHEMRLLVVESGCRYHAEAAFPDIVHVGLRLGRLGGSSWTTLAGLFRNADDTAFAEGHFVQVHVAAATGRPATLPDTVRVALGTLRVG